MCLSLLSPLPRLSLLTVPPLGFAGPAEDVVWHPGRQQGKKVRPENYQTTKGGKRRHAGTGRDWSCAVLENVAPPPTALAGPPNYQKIVSSKPSRLLFPVHRSGAAGVALVAAVCLHFSSLFNFAPHERQPHAFPVLVGSDRPP
jgi:hypothetical protein